MDFAILQIEVNFYRLLDKVFCLDVNVLVH